jgi:hypothetical protein
VLLVALWVRSYWREYTLVVGLTDHRGFIFDSSAGTVMVNYLHEFGTRTGEPQVVLSRWWLGRSGADEFVTSWGFPTERFLFRRDSSSGNLLIKMPHWIPVLVTGVLGGAAASAQRLRFSIRTLLIATALVAAGLGTIVVLN